MTIVVKPKEAQPIGVPGLPRPQRPAHVIGSRFGETHAAIGIAP
jgi:hypothetical protein